MKHLRIHYIQHVPFEDPGYIKTWVSQNNHVLSSTKLYQGEILPSIDEFDWLIVMGGPMGIGDEDQYPWLKKEKEFIKGAIDADKIVIGICLGAQLIADALGARVFPNNKKEIGWYPIDFTDQSSLFPVFKDNPGAPMVLHWHGDTFDLPAGATHLVKTDVCTNQAFLYGKKVLALQFHLEATPETLGAMIENCGDELVCGEYIQSAEDILEGEKYCAESNFFLVQLLNYLFDI